MNIGMLFPGYGSQFVGMAKELYDQSRVVQEYFEEASACLNTNFVKLCFASSDSDLAKMANAYPALFLVSSALYAHLKHEGIEPGVVAGYNIGEYAAVFAAGGMSFPDGLYVLSKYTQFYNELLEKEQYGCFEVTGLLADQLQTIVTKVSTSSSHLYIAVYQSLDQHIVAGHVNALEKARKLIESLHESVVIQDVDTAVGLHSPLMNPVLDQFKIYLGKVDFKNLRIPLISNTSGKPIESSAHVVDAITDNMVMPIRFLHALQALPACDAYVQVGPGNQVAELYKRMYPDRLIVSINKPADIDELKKIISNNGDLNGI